MRFAIFLILGLAALPGAVSAEDKYPPLEVLLSSSETTIGQKFSYPDGPAKITAAIVTMLPGQETGLHVHDAPLFGYMLSGELTVDYGADGRKTYRTGDSLIEAFKTPHDGKNTGTEAVRILVVFAGAENVPNTQMVK